ncbi:hypothetical protein BD311DRAFT_800919 [Dichomitus squalens]|uniref:Uncharacterized protein n=2 Tax=Dichomitus squalens TaxID=114155 RepID=A0A4Q9M5Z3_9APHY|nr:hypothetical protein BD311DRAFT_800919 [Dichomitus squalens]
MALAPRNCPPKIPLNAPPRDYRYVVREKGYRPFRDRRLPQTITFTQAPRGNEPAGYVPPPGVLMLEIRGRRPQYVIADPADTPLELFITQGVSELLLLIWAPDKYGGYSHHGRVIPISEYHRTNRRDGLAEAVMVEYSQMPPIRQGLHNLNHRLVALHHFQGNAYWAELADADGSVSDSVVPP